MHASLLPPLHIPTDLSFGQFLLKYNPDHVPADKVVLEDLAEPHDKLTYGGIRHETARLAGALRQVYGIRPGDAVIIYAVNSVAWLRLAHAVMWMGGILVCINAAVSEHELPHYLKIAKATHCFSDAGLCPKMDAALKQSPGIGTQVLELGGTLQKLRAHSASPIEPIDLAKMGNKNTVAMVLFSSGTSSLPKGVQLSHYNLLAQALSARVSTPETTCQDAREVFFPPLAHMFGLASVVLPTAVSGSYVMLMPSFTYPGFIEGSARIRANVMRTVPAIAVMIAKDPNISKYDLSCVKSLICAGATLQEEIVSRLQDVFAGVEITQGYVVLSPEIKKQDYPALLKEIRQSVDTKVSGYKKLRGGVVAIDALPKNHTGKLARNELPARKEMLKMMEAKVKAKL